MSQKKRKQQIKRSEPKGRKKAKKKTALGAVLLDDMLKKEGEGLKDIKGKLDALIGESFNKPCEECDGTGQRGGILCYFCFGDGRHPAHLGRGAEEGAAVIGRCVYCQQDMELDRDECFPQHTMPESQDFCPGTGNAAILSGGVVRREEQP